MSGANGPSGRERGEGSDWRLAVDIGGTFTDVVLLDAASGRVELHGQRVDGHHEVGVDGADDHDAH